MSEIETESQLLEVPFASLSEKALRGIIEAFILREGTDYGDKEFSLDEKVIQVLGQLKRQEVLIIFDTKEETFDIRSKRKASSLLRPL